jgi:hypothetical protein
MSVPVVHRAPHKWAAPRRYAQCIMCMYSTVCELCQAHCSSSKTLDLLD